MIKNNSGVYDIDGLSLHATGFDVSASLVADVSVKVYLWVKIIEYLPSLVSEISTSGKQIVTDWFS